MKKCLSIIIAVLMLFSVCPMLFACGATGSTSGGSNGGGGGGVSSESQKMEKIQEFYDIVSETQELLDIVADDIYSYWYGAIYKDKYFGSIDLAILAAQDDNEENLAKIETNTETIKSLYSQIKDSSLGTEIKAVMQAYNAYYSLVVEVSGSFNTYSSEKESLKKDLSNALKNLSIEL